MGMLPLLRHAASRLLQALGLVLAVVVLNFVLVHAAPGDPVETIAGASGGMSPELMAQLRTQYGLDKSLPVQLAVYLGKVAQGDLGYSYFFNLPVTQMIGERLPATLLLVLSSVLLAFFAGTALGCCRRASRTDGSRSSSPCCRWWASRRRCSGWGSCW